MCGWTYAAAALIAAYGANQQAEAQNEAADRQQAALNAALEQSDQWNQKAEAKALENADEYKMQDRTQRFEEARQEAGDSLAQSLVKSREESATPTVASGKLSEAFIADRAGKMADQLQNSLDMARLMGNMKGTSNMLGDESLTNANYASDLNTIGRNAKGDWSAAQPGIAAAGKVDSGAMALGGLAQGLGTAYLSSGLGSAFGSSSPALTSSGYAGELTGAGGFGSGAGVGSSSYNGIFNSNLGFNTGSGLGSSFKLM